MRFRQHIPAFFSGYEPYVVEDWSGDPYALPDMQLLSDFHQFSRDPVGPDSGYLIEETHEGAHWWVIGKYTGGQPDLPVWAKPR